MIAGSALRTHQALPGRGQLRLVVAVVHADVRGRDRLRVRAGQRAVAARDGAPLGADVERDVELAAADRHVGERPSTGGARTGGAATRLTATASALRTWKRTRKTS